MSIKEAIAAPLHILSAARAEISKLRQLLEATESDCYKLESDLGKLLGELEKTRQKKWPPLVEFSELGELDAEPVVRDRTRD